MINQIILIGGIILITIGFSRMYFMKDNSQIIYRYIPRTFQEDQDNQPSLSDLFGSMFEGSEPRDDTFYEQKVIDIRKL